MTGDQAVVDPKVSGMLTAGDGYIHATFTILDPGKRIVHIWRTIDFPPESKDSVVEILFESAELGTKLTLIHTQIPTGQAMDYKSGWRDFYFTPMKAYFQKKKSKSSKSTQSKK